MDVSHLFLALGVETDHLLARRRLQRLLEVGAQSTPARIGLVRDTVASVDGTSLVRGLELAIEVRERIREPIRDAVLVVELDRTLNRLVADDVAMSEILGDDARARLVFLLDVALLGRVSTLGWVVRGGFGDVVKAVRAADLNLSRPKLSIVQEKSRFGRAVSGCEKVLNGN